MPDPATPASSTRPAPLPGLAVAAALAVPLVVAAGDAGWLAVALAAIGLVTLAVVDFARAVDPARLTVVREAPAAMALGGDSQITWTVTSPRPVTVDLVDDVAPGLGVAQRDARLEIGRAGGAAESSTDLTPTSRGHHRLGQLAVRCHGPLRLMARQRRLDADAVVVVRPSAAGARAALARIDRHRLTEIGLRAAVGKASGTEFDQLKEHTPDDDPRHIDWSATARYGSPIVRTYRPERDRPVLVMLDVGRQMAGSVDGATRLTHATEAVLALAAVAVRLGDRIGLVAYDAEIRSIVQPGSGPAQISRIADVLAGLEPRLVETDHRAAFAMATARFRRRSLLVAVTDLSAPVIDGILAPAVPILRRRHTVAVAAVADPRPAQWRDADPADLTAAWRQVAAVDHLADRARARAQLARMGATVVDASAADLPARLADHYLRIRSTGG